VLKPLDAAVRDGDPIRAVIRETGANQDGRTPTLTSPSREAQEDLMRKCYARAGLDPVNTGYVEAHGTGTQAGDTSEAFAVGTVLGSLPQRRDPLLVGSVKTNIGHTEATSGLAGVIKAVLAVESGLVPPLLNFENPNPKIPFNKLGLKIPLAVTEFPASVKRRASVNNFGYGGSNAHVIVEHPDYLVPYYQSRHPKTVPKLNAPGRMRVLKLAAKDEASLVSVVAATQSYVRGYLQHQHSTEEEDVFLDRLVYTLGERRSQFPWNTTVCAAKAQDILDGEFSKPQRASRPPRLGLVFSGQGAQWCGMGRELLTAYPVFRDALQEADACLRKLGASWSLLGMFLYVEPHDHHAHRY
jgi:acyl transferase domain-containing protein